MFRKWDKDGNGEISLEEFREGMKATTKLGDEDIDRIFKNLDADDGRSITIDELVISSAYDALVAVDERLFDMFVEMDENGDGKLDSEELKHAMEKFGIADVDLQRAELILKEIDENGDGKIDYEEFLHALHPTMNELSLTQLVKTRSRGFTLNPNLYDKFFSEAKKSELIKYHFDNELLMGTLHTYHSQKRASEENLSGVAVAGIVTQAERDRNAAEGDDIIVTIRGSVTEEIRIAGNEEHATTTTTTTTKVSDHLADEDSDSNILIIKDDISLPTTSIQNQTITQNNNNDHDHSRDTDLRNEGQSQTKNTSNTNNTGPNPSAVAVAKKRKPTGNYNDAVGEANTFLRDKNLEIQATLGPHKRRSTLGDEMPDYVPPSGQRVANFFGIGKKGGGGARQKKKKKKKIKIEIRVHFVMHALYLMTSFFLQMCQLTKTISIFSFHVPFFYFFIISFIIFFCNVFLGHFRFHFCRPNVTNASQLRHTNNLPLDKFQLKNLKKFLGNKQKSNNIAINQSST
ncbi:Protein kinase domain containing protein [Reticulomyxa filosa]|uniref:Protein kinase domain containing protein n=1 Tax=Reticulomyxa filosa TaxID=46433 RepID=X6LUD2_RETFI|nr:Protein kinase domain containing protein [Reticulomyxa filosa]|eukprot:ETO05528.1 Protein kinase domain containing protein [Reticulomyxa filosa]